MEHCHNFCGIVLVYYGQNASMKCYFEEQYSIGQKDLGHINNIFSNMCYIPVLETWFIELLSVLVRRKGSIIWYVLGDETCLPAVKLQTMDKKKNIYTYI